MACRSRRRLSSEDDPKGIDEVCALCAQPNTNMTSPKSWKDPPASVNFISSQDLSSDSQICRPCRHDISRVIKYPSIITRWGKQERGFITESFFLPLQFLMNVYMTWGWTLLLMFHYQNPSVNTTIFLSRNFLPHVQCFLP